MTACEASPPHPGWKFRQKVEGLTGKRWGLLPDEARRMLTASWADGMTAEEAVAYHGLANTEER